MKQSKLIQMRLLPRTIDKVTSLQEITGINNRTQLVAISIDVAEDIAKAMSEGSSIIIERKNGEREKMKVIGFNQ